MKAMTRSEYGSPDVFQMEEVEIPESDSNRMGEDQVLVKVHATSCNPADWHFMRGTPRMVRIIAGLFKPKHKIIGSDMAGQVVAVGSQVTKFKPGDKVYSMLMRLGMGVFAEYVSVAEEHLARVPDNISLEDAGSIPMAALTAWHALVSVGKVQPGQKVLINGASGGVGTFAVQMARALGAEVTGVCSTGKMEMVRSLGADHVIDYKFHNFTTRDKQYDLILDNVANHSLLDLKRAMQPGGLCLIIGYFTAWRLFIHMIGTPLASLFGKRKFKMLDWKYKVADLETIGTMIESGQVKPEIDRRYPFEQLPEAMAYVEEGHARAKVIVQILKSEDSPQS